MMLNIRTRYNYEKIKCTILDSLIVNNVNVLTEIANKASTSSLSSYVLTSALTTALSSYVAKNNATFTGIITIPNLEITGTIGSTSSSLKLRSGVSTLEPQIELSVTGNRDITLRTPVSVLSNITTPIMFLMRLIMHQR